MIINERMCLMSELTKTSDQYKKWISEISKRYRQSQIKASIKVNIEMMRFYWELGKELHDKKGNFPWVKNFYKIISRDLQREIPNVISFSETNLRYMECFYMMFPNLEDLSEGESELDLSKEDRLTSNVIFSIPWGHFKAILDKCRGKQQKALFFVKQVIKNGWSRGVLLNFLDTDLYERQGKAITNFSDTLPPIQSDIAQEITKDPYKFDFLSLRENYNEKELKNALLDNVQRFLLELGNGFAFLGREYRIEIGDTENFTDMLFYHTKLHSYVVVEVKVTEFESMHMGQLGTYVVAINHQLKTDKDGPTLGLLVCKSKDNVKAQYSLEASSQPMGISAYEVSNLNIDHYEGSLPSVDEIERELSKRK